MSLELGDELTIGRIPDLRDAIGEGGHHPRAGRVERDRKDQTRRSP